MKKAFAAGHAKYPDMGYACLNGICSYVWSILGRKFLRLYCWIKAQNMPENIRLILS